MYKVVLNSPRSAYLSSLILIFSQDEPVVSFSFGLCCVKSDFCAFIDSSALPRGPFHVCLSKTICSVISLIKQF